MATKRNNTKLNPRRNTKKLPLLRNQGCRYVGDSLTCWICGKPKSVDIKTNDNI